MKKSLWIFFLLFATLVAVYPFVWMLLSCFKTNREIYQPTLLFPANYQWDVFLALFDGDYLPFWQILSNSLFYFHRAGSSGDFDFRIGWLLSGKM